MRAFLFLFIIILSPLISFGQSTISADTLLIEEYYHPFDSTLSEEENKQQAINITFLNALENTFGKIIVTSNDMTLSNSNESNTSNSSSSFKSRTKSLVSGKISKVLELVFEKRTLEKNKTINGERVKTKILYDYVKVKFLARESEQPVVFEQEIDQISKQVGLINSKVEKNTSDINQIKEETEISVVNPIETALKFYNEKKYNQATRYFKIGLSRVKNSNFGDKYAYYYHLADSYLMHGDHSNSILYADSLLLLNPFEPSAISFKTAALFLSGKPNDGLTFINNYLLNVEEFKGSRVDTLLKSLTKFSNLNKEVIFKGLGFQVDYGNHTIYIEQKLRNSFYTEELSKEVSNKKLESIISANRKIKQTLNVSDIIINITRYLTIPNTNLSSAAKFILDIKTSKNQPDIHQTFIQNRKLSDLKGSFGIVTDSTELKKPEEYKWVIANTGKEYRGYVFQFSSTENWEPLGGEAFERGIYTFYNPSDSVKIEELECPCDVLIHRGVYDELIGNSGSILINDFTHSEQIFNSGWIYLIAGDFKSSINLYSSVVKYYIKLGRLKDHNQYLKDRETQIYNMAIINLAHSYLLNGDYEKAAKQYKNVYLIDFDESYDNHSSKEVIKLDWADFISRKLISQNIIDDFKIKYLDKFFESK